MKGFSLIEILVVLGILGIVGSISVVTYNTMRKVGDVKHATYVFVDALKEAKNKAKIMEYNIDWGVNLSNTDIVVFGGSSYSGRDTSKDKTFDIPDGLTITGPTEIVFSKFTGLPTISGDIIFSNDFGSSTVSLSSGGTVSY